MNWDRLLDEQAIAALLPVDNVHFAKPVCEALAVFLAGLSERRQAEIFAQQLSLGPQVEISERLGLLAQSCPVLHKIGQVLARDQRLSPALRQHLVLLESLPPSIPWETIQNTLEHELGDLTHLGITLKPPALAEASVAVVVPFHRSVGSSTQHGVFKVLKPAIEEIIGEELEVLERVGAHLDERCRELRIPHLDYQDAFQQVRGKLLEEICLDHEQRNIAAAREIYADNDCVQIPALLQYCTSRVTSMQRVWGDKVTDHKYSSDKDRNRLARLVVDAMIAQPVFSQIEKALFHGDPHAGNLFLTTDGRLAVLDWSLVGFLAESEKTGLVQVMLGAIMQDERRMVSALLAMSSSSNVEHTELIAVVRLWLQKLRAGQFPGLFFLTGMLDMAVQTAGLRLNPDLLMFRKSLFSLEGVVAEVGKDTAVFDQVLMSQFLKHFIAEWPARWLALPNSRGFATRLSNFDLAQTTAALPLSIVRFWLGQGVDWLQASQRTMTIMT